MSESAFSVYYLQTTDSLSHYTSIMHIAQRIVSFPCITLLDGHEDYDVWASSMKAVRGCFKLYELLAEEKWSEPGTSPDENEAYDAMYLSAKVLYLQVVGPTVIKHNVSFNISHEMWMYLKSKSKCGSSFGLVFQLGKIMDVHNNIEDPTSVLYLVRQLNTKWLMFSKLSEDSTDYHRVLLTRCLNMNKSKCDFILGMFSRHHLIDVEFVSSSQNSAFLTERQGTKFAVFIQVKSSKVHKKRICSYCLKHFPSQTKGHTWQYCQKKRVAKSLKNRSKMNTPVEELAYMTSMTDEQVNSKPFYLDTCATSHMCPYPERFEYLSVHSGFVKSSSGQCMAVKGKGNIVLQCKLSDGSYSCFRIYDVLYVPKLTCPLVSWYKLRTQNYQMYDDGVIIRLFKGSKTFLEAKFIGTLPVITETDQKAIYNAFLT